MGPSRIPGRLWWVAGSQLPRLFIILPLLRFCMGAVPCGDSPPMTALPLPPCLVQVVDWAGVTVGCAASETALRSGP